MNRSLFALLIVLTVMLPLSASAQLGPVDDSGVSDPEAAEEVQKFQESLSANRFGGEPMELRLADAVAQGIENNLQLQVQRFNPLIAFEGQEGAWGSFDPIGKADWTYLSDTDPVAGSALFGDERTRHKENVTNLGVEGMVPWLGATLGVDVNLNKTNDINRFTAQRPTYESGFTVKGSLPLLKGLIWNEPWTRVKTSETQYAGSKQTFRTDLMDVVQFIETNYWNLVAQRQSVRVAEKSLETALSLLDQTKTQYEVGVKSKVEVVESEAGVASREFDLIRAVNRYRRAQDDLIDAVFGTQLTAGSRTEVLPSDDAEGYVTYQIDVVEAAEKAFQFRPELQAAKYEIDRQEFELKFAKNQRLPQLDVVGSYGTNGRVGEGVGLRNFDGSPALGPTTGNGFDDSIDDFWTDRGGETVRVGAVLSIPLGNIGARHSVSRRQLELRRANTQLLQLRQNIILEVRDTARNLQSAQEGIEAASRRQEAAAEQLRAERVRLEYGESTPFNVLLKEEDLVEAENEKILAVFTYRKSVVDLHRAQGTILQTRNIVVEEAATLR